MTALLRTTAILLGLFTAITGVIYPLAVTGVAHAFFSASANGSLVMQKGRSIGSSLIGQPFDDARYFWGRPSATSPHAYNAAASSGSNLGPSNPAFLEAVEARIEALRAAHPDQAAAPVPIDLATASASGLDPHVSPAAALYQAHRVARARNVSVDHVRALVEQHVEGRTWGVLGEPRVNVLLLNAALDELSPSGLHDGEQRGYPE